MCVGGGGGGGDILIIQLDLVKACSEEYHSIKIIYLEII